MHFHAESGSELVVTICVKMDENEAGKVDFFMYNFLRKVGGGEGILEAF
jgi:hypothetical protein